MKTFLFAAAAMIFLIAGQPTANAQTAQGAASQNTPAAQDSAPAAAKDSGIAGKWHFVMDTPGGDREMDAEFIVDKDGNVTGKYGNTAVAGTYKDGKMDLNFSMTSEESGETAPLKLEGKLDETNALIGTWAFSSYDGTFKATRPKL
ncbi:MAG: hypothetical protein WB608_22195 [Terracidiphilus sp.]